MPHPSRLRLPLIWFAVLLVAAVAVSLQRKRTDESAALASDEGGLVEPREPDEVAVQLAPISIQSELVGKLTIAVQALAPDFSPSDLLSNAAPLKAGSAVDQLAYSVLVGSIESWEQGAIAAHAVVIDPQAAHAAALLTLRDDVVAALEIRAASVADGATDTASVSDETLERIEAKLGYYGRLLGPDAAAGEAASTLVVMLAVGGWYITVFLIGSVVLLAIAIVAISGKLRPRFEPVSDTHAGIVLGEVFLLWIVAFLGLSVCAELALANFGGSDSVAVHLGMSMIAMLASLFTLVFASARGVSPRQLRTMIGLHRGEGLIKEALFGIGCYLSAVPILALGLLVFVALNFVSEQLIGESPAPSHPAVEMLGSASAIEIMLLFMLASVVAPFVEEIAFRGLLYGHLRAVVAPRMRFISLLVAAIGSSFIFAVIHPQGVLFVPALGGLAVGFCIFRELRGSLVAPMVAHAVNNAVTLAIGLTLLG